MPKNSAQERTKSGREDPRVTNTGEGGLMGDSDVKEIAQ